MIPCDWSCYGSVVSFVHLPDDVKFYEIRECSHGIRRAYPVSPEWVVDQDGELTRRAA